MLLENEYIHVFTNQWPGHGISRKQRPLKYSYLFFMHDILVTVADWISLNRSAEDSFLFL